MKRTNSIVTMCLAAGVAASAAIGIAAAQQDKAKPTPTPTPATQPAATKPSTPTPPAKPSTPAVKPGEGAMPQIPGMTPEEMQKMGEAMQVAMEITDMHKHLAKGVGSWKGECQMWMAPDAPPTKSECTMTCKTIMNGLFTQCEMKGNIPDMGPMDGMGLYGYDNVAKKFQATWVTSCGGGMMQGTGQMESDGSTITWTYSHTCPMQKKPCTIREVDKFIDENTRSFTTYGPDFRTGKEYKMMEVTFKRTSK